MAKYLESKHQIAFVQWVKFKYPVISKYLIAIPNDGATTARRGLIMKQQGVRRGASDIFIAYPFNGKHGLFIEMKHEKGKLTPFQEEFIAEMKEIGYEAGVCYGLDDAIKVFESYIGAQCGS